jgi:hypothetical protein
MGSGENPLLFSFQNRQNLPIFVPKTIQTTTNNDKLDKLRNAVKSREKGHRRKQANLASKNTTIL